MLQLGRRTRLRLDWTIPACLDMSWLREQAMIIDRISVGRYGGSLDDMMGNAGKLLAIGPGSVLDRAPSSFSDMGPGSVSNTGLGTLWHGEPGWELILRDTWCISALWTAQIWGKNGSIKTYQDREAFTKNARKTNLTRRRVHHSLPLVFVDLSGMLAHLWRKNTYTYFGVFHITSYESKGQFPTEQVIKAKDSNTTVWFCIPLAFCSQMKTHFPRCAT